MTSYTKLLMVPLLGFLAASCSTTSNLQSSEVDDVYFSSSDKVTSVEPVYSSDSRQASSPEEREQYSLNDASGDISDRVSDPGSYADDDRLSDDYDYQYNYYDAPFGNPFYAYGSPYYSGFYPRYSSFAMMDPFYSPYGPAFYDPFMGSRFGMGSMFGMGYGLGWPAYYGGLSVSLGMGWGGFGRYYSPFGYPGFYGSPYGRYGFYDTYYAGALRRNYNYGPRNDRSTSVARRRPDNNTTETGNSRFDQRSRAGVASPGYRNTRSRAAGVDNTATYPSGSYPSDVNTSRSRRNRSGEVYSPGGIPSTETRTRRSTIYNNNDVQRSQRRSSDYTPTYEPSRSNSSSFPSSSGGSREGSSGGSMGGGRRGRN